MNEGVVISEKSFRESVPAWLFDEIVQATPTHVTIPRHFHVAHHLPNACAFEESGSHRVRAIEMSHQAIADGHVYFWVGRFDEVSFAF